MADFTCAKVRLTKAVSVDRSVGRSGNAFFRRSTRRACGPSWPSLDVHRTNMISFANSVIKVK